MSNKLARKTLGHSNLEVSELCLGGMTLANFHAMELPVAGEELAIKLLNKFEEHGGNFIDTANLIYGDSELVIGRWLSSRPRDKFVIATKVGTGAGQPDKKGGLGQKHIKEQIDESLKRLQTSYIDLYQCHTPDANTPIEETLRTFDELVKAGKVRNIGVSNYAPGQLQKAIDFAKYNGLTPIYSLQPQYHLLCRNVEWELAKVCTNEGLGIIPWSPLAFGWLTGRYKKNEKPEEGSRLGWLDKLPIDFAGLNQAEVWTILDAVEKIAKETNHTMSQVSLRWLMQKPGVTAPIIGVRTMAQLEENLGAAGWTLTEEQMNTLDTVSKVDLPYPYAVSKPKQTNKEGGGGGATETKK